MNASRPILIVEDDAALRATLAEQFAAGGEFLPEEAESAATAEAKLADTHRRFDAVLLDIGLPDGDGRDLCARMRRAGKRMPVIMLTGANDEMDVVRGLDAGANDYIAKPFGVPELLARLRAQLRTFDNSDDAVMAVGPYEFQPSAKLLTRKGTRDRIRLTNKEVAIVKYLHRASGKPVARAVLLNEVWGYNSGVTTHTLETHIYRLRQKIETVPSQPRLLVTLASGYMLDAATA